MPKPTLRQRAERAAARFYDRHERAVTAIAAIALLVTAWTLAAGVVQFGRLVWRTLF